MPLQSPISVTFVTIHGKHMDREPKQGCFTALNDTGGVLETDSRLEQYLNLQIETGAENKLFAKVIRHEDSGWLLRFTAKPPNFARWRTKHTQTTELGDSE